MASGRHPLSAPTVEAALQPWIVQPPETNSIDLTGVAAVREEAHLIHQIVRCAGVVASSDEIRRTFCRTPREFHLAEALLTGGIKGEFHADRMLHALRAAAAWGSTWAPLWLGDVELLWEEKENTQGLDDQAALECRRRNWYLEAAARGHPDASHRLAIYSPTSPAAAPKVGAPFAEGVADERPRSESFSNAFLQGGSVPAKEEEEEEDDEQDLRCAEEEEKDEPDFVNEEAALVNAQPACQEAAKELSSVLPYKVPSVYVVEDGMKELADTTINIAETSKGKPPDHMLGKFFTERLRQSTPPRSRL